MHEGRRSSLRNAHHSGSFDREEDPSRQRRHSHGEHHDHAKGKDAFHGHRMHGDSSEHDERSASSSHRSASRTSKKGVGFAGAQNRDEDEHDNVGITRRRSSGLGQKGHDKGHRRSVGFGDAEEIVMEDSSEEQGEPAVSTCTSVYVCMFGVYVY